MPKIAHEPARRVRRRSQYLGGGARVSAAPKRIAAHVAHRDRARRFSSPAERALGRSRSGCCKRSTSATSCPTSSWERPPERSTRRSSRHEHRPQRQQRRSGASGGIFTVRTSSSDLAVDSAGEAHHSRALGARRVGDVRLAVGADTEAVDESQVGALDRLDQLAGRLHHPRRGQRLRDLPVRVRAARAARLHEHVAGPLGQQRPKRVQSGQPGEPRARRSPPGKGSPCGRSATSQRQPSPGRSSWMPTTITPRGQRGPAGVIRASGQHDRQGDGGRLIQQLGFAAVDTGGLASGWRPRRPGTPVYGTDQRRAQGWAALALWPVPLRQERVRSQGGGGRRPGWPRIAARSGRSCSWPWPPAATASPSSTWHGDAGPDRCLSGRAAAGPQEGDVRGIAGAAALRPTGYRWCMERSRCAAGSRHREEARC